MALFLKRGLLHRVRVLWRVFERRSGRRHVEFRLWLVTRARHVPGRYLRASPRWRHAEFLAGLLDWVGVSRPVAVTGGAEVRWLESGSERLLFAFNHQDHAVKPSITLRGDWPAVDLVSGAAVSAPFRKRLAPGDVWVLRLRHR